MSVTAHYRSVTRRYKRYIVVGSVELQSSTGASSGRVLNLGQGGMLVRTDSICQEGARLSLRFQVGGHSNTLTALGEVVGIKDDLLAVKFMEQPTEMGALLRWLEQENFSWSGVA